MSELEVGTIKIMVSGSEKVGLPGYSSVDIGPVSLTRVIEEGDEEYIKEQLRKNIYIVEELIAEIRQEVLEAVQEAKKN